MSSTEAASFEKQTGPAVWPNRHAFFRDGDKCEARDSFSMANLPKLHLAALPTHCVQEQASGAFATSSELSEQALGTSHLVQTKSPLLAAEKLLGRSHEHCAHLDATGPLPSDCCETHFGASCAEVSGDCSHHLLHSLSTQPQEDFDDSPVVSSRDCRTVHRPTAASNHWQDPLTAFVPTTLPGEEHSQQFKTLHEHYNANVGPQQSGAGPPDMLVQHRNSEELQPQECRPQNGELLIPRQLSTDQATLLQLRRQWQEDNFASPRFSSCSPPAAAHSDDLPAVLPSASLSDGRSHRPKRNCSDHSPKAAHPQFHPTKSVIATSKPKLRLRWTPQLHSLFLSAVSTLGGPEKATPKQIIKMMAVPQLNIFHVKSHLQKIRLNERKSGDHRQWKRPCSSGSQAHKCDADDLAADDEDSGRQSFSSLSPPLTITTAGTTNHTVAKAARDHSGTSSLGTETRKAPSEHQSLVEEAMHRQLTMQKQLQMQLQAQHQIQNSLDAHAHYIEQLLAKGSQHHMCPKGAEGVEGSIPGASSGKCAGRAASLVASCCGAPASAHEASTSPLYRSPPPLATPEAEMQSLSRSGRLPSGGTSSTTASPAACGLSLRRSHRRPVAYGRAPAADSAEPQPTEIVHEAPGWSLCNYVGSWEEAVPSGVQSPAAAADDSCPTPHRQAAQQCADKQVELAAMALPTGPPSSARAQTIESRANSLLSPLDCSVHGASSDLRLPFEQAEATEGVTDPWASSPGPLAADALSRQDEPIQRLFNDNNDWSMVD